MTRQTGECPRCGRVTPLRGNQAEAFCRRCLAVEELEERAWKGQAWRTFTRIEDALNKESRA